VQEGGDVGPLGVCDMAGNGTEFTKGEMQEEGPAKRKLVILRGKSWTAPGPLTYEELQEQQEKLPRVQFHDSPSPFTGFRVVLTPPEVS
jgi:hypothetical protein